MGITTKFIQIDRQKLVLVSIIALIMITMSFLSPRFLLVNNFVNILLQLAPLIIIACAANLLMITGNFDLSIGSVLAFSAIMHAYLTKQGLPIEISIIACCLFSIVWGVTNGIMVGVLNVNPVIATMGTMYAARGFAYLIARWDGGANISAGLPPDFSAFGRTNVFGFVPIIIIFLILAVVIFIFIEKKTVLGRFSFAIGGNRTASILSGIKVPLVIISLYENDEIGHDLAQHPFGKPCKITLRSFDRCMGVDQHIPGNLCDCLGCHLLQPFLDGAIERPHLVTVFCDQLGYCHFKHEGPEVDQLVFYSFFFDFF